MNKRAVDYSLLFTVDVILLVIIGYYFLMSVTYSIENGDRDDLKFILYGLVLLGLVYLAIKHARMRKLPQSKVATETNLNVSKWQARVYIGLLIALIAPMVVYFIAIMFGADSAGIGFGVGLFYVGWLVFLGVVFIVSTIIFAIIDKKSDVS